MAIVEVFRGGRLVVVAVGIRSATLAR